MPVTVLHTLQFLSTVCWFNSVVWLVASTSTNANLSTCEWQKQTNCLWAKDHFTVQRQHMSNSWTTIQWLSNKTSISQHEAGISIKVPHASILSHNITRLILRVHKGVHIYISKHNMQVLQGQQDFGNSPLNWFRKSLKMTQEKTIACNNYNSIRVLYHPFSA